MVTVHVSDRNYDIHSKPSVAGGFIVAVMDSKSGAFEVYWQADPKDDRWQDKFLRSVNSRVFGQRLTRRADEAKLFYDRPQPTN
jgi:hypothetical protein